MTFLKNYQYKLNILKHVHFNLVNQLEKLS